DAALARFSSRDDDALWRLRELRALALISRGKWQDVLDAAMPELPRRLRRSDAAVNRLRTLAIAYHQLSRFDEAKRSIDDAGRLATTPQLHAEVQFTRATMQHVFRDPAVRERYARDALRSAKRAGDLTLQSKVTGTLTLILASEGRYDEAIDTAEKLKRIAETLRDESLIAKTEGNLGWYYNLIGDPETAAEHLQRALALCVKQDAKENQIVDLL